MQSLTVFVFQNENNALGHIVGGKLHKYLITLVFDVAFPPQLTINLA